MTILEAKKKAINYSGSSKFESCMLYGNILVFELSGESGNAIDNLVSVNIKTGEVRDFKPFLVSVEEYKKGVKIF